MGQGAGQGQPCEGVQNRLDGERLGSRDLTLRTASFCPLPLIPHLYHGSFEGSGGGGALKSQLWLTWRKKIHQQTSRENEKGAIQ